MDVTGGTLVKFIVNGPEGGLRGRAAEIQPEQGCVPPVSPPIQQEFAGAQLKPEAHH